MILSDVIRRIEVRWPPFNQEPLTIDDLFVWAEELGMKLIADPREKLGSLRCWGGCSYIFYNPTRLDGEIAYAVAHEIGHFLLGHKKQSRKAEWAADVIAHLALCPTPVIDRLLEEHEYFDPAHLHANIRVAMCREFAWQFCHDRLQIYWEYVRQKNLPK